MLVEIYLSGAMQGLLQKYIKYIQENSTSVEGKDFTDAIQKAQLHSISGVATASTVKGYEDLAYLFAASKRYQTGRGLSDKDFENALKTIVSGGVWRCWIEVLNIRRCFQNSLKRRIL